MTDAPNPEFMSGTQDVGRSRPGGVDERNVKQSANQILNEIRGAEREGIRGSLYYIPHLSLTPSPAVVEVAGYPPQTEPRPETRLVRMAEQTPGRVRCRSGCRECCLIASRLVGCQSHMVTMVLFTGGKMVGPVPEGSPMSKCHFPTQFKQGASGSNWFVVAQKADVE